MQLTPTVEVVRVTPDLAHEILAGNTINRNVRRQWVKFLAEELTGGRWHLTNDAVMITPDGTLMNGQHRLLAIISAETAGDLLVIRNADIASLPALDIPTKRNLADALKLAGFTDLTVTAATVGMIFKLTDPERQFPTALSVRYSFEPQIEFAVKHSDALQQATAVAAKVRRRLVFPGSMVGALWFLQSDIDPDDATEFWESVTEGLRLDQNDPRFAWRRWVERERTRANHRSTTAAKMAVSIKAWNYWRDGITIDFISWKPGGASPEPFPTLR